MKLLKIIPKIFLALAFIFAGFLAAKPEKDSSQAGEMAGYSQSGLTALSNPSLLDNKAKDKTDWFANIIPEAKAAIPFDDFPNRKLTLYAGVASVINGDKDDTYVLEMGKLFKPTAFPWIPGGLGIYSSGSLILGAKTATSENFIKLASDNGTSYFPGQIYTGMQGAGRFGDLHIYREGNCSSGSCRALTNLENNNLLTLNYNNDFFGGTYTPGKFYVGFTPNSATAENFDSLLVKNNSPASSALYAEQTGAGYAGYFSGKVKVTGNLEAGALCLSGDCKSSWPPGSGGVVSTGTVNWVPKFSPNGNTLVNSIIYETGDKIGIGQNSPMAKFVVNNPKDAVGKTGDENDAIYAYANSNAGFGAAISAEQGGTDYAGYFSGKVGIKSPSVPLYVESSIFDQAAQFIGGSVTIGDLTTGRRTQVGDSYDGALSIYSMRKTALYVDSSSPAKAAELKGDVDIKGNLKIQATTLDSEVQDVWTDAALVASLTAETDRCDHSCTEQGRTCLFGTGRDGGGNFQIFGCYIDVGTFGYSDTKCFCYATP